MFSKVKFSHIVVALLLCTSFLGFNSLKAQNQIGMELLIPYTVILDSNGVDIISPFADKEALQNELYTETHYVDNEKMNNLSRELNRAATSEAKEEEIIFIVHYL